MELFHRGSLPTGGSRVSQHREVHREILSLPDRPYIDVSVSRVLEALVAGTSRMHWGTFVFYSVLGGTIWATAVVLAGSSLSGWTIHRKSISSVENRA
jgi:hypothetical protein